MSSLEKTAPVRSFTPGNEKISITDGDACWTGFTKLAGAIAFREKHLCRSTVIITDDDRDMDTSLILFGSSIRDLLAKSWRDEQYERMFRGQEFSLTDGLSSHMSDASNLIAAEILREVSGEGWVVRTGHVEKHIERGRPPIEHSWLRHHSGTILDLTSDKFTGSPVMTFHEDSQVIWQYEDQGELELEAASEMARIWLEEVSPDFREIALLRAGNITMPDFQDMPQI